MNNLVIMVNTDRLVTDINELDKERLDKYNVCVPSKNSSGQMADQLNAMAQTMFRIYNQVDQMIDAITKMLELIKTKTTEADEKACELY